MANSEAGTSGDAVRVSGGEYQVFLSFRGDTPYGFTDFLYHDLVDAGVRVFKQDDELREVIGENLLHVINNSIIYIPIFSRTYASRKWCLQELALIVDNVSKSEDQKSILPIFLDVEPEDVKLETPLYSTAFQKHQEDFPKEVEAWRKALAEVDEIKGWNVKKDQSQAAIVKLVVEEVLGKLEIKRKSVTEYLVGLDDRVKHVTELLDVDHRDVRLIGIYGKDGIGKTTVAKVIFNKLSSYFGKCCSFLENVRESSLTKEGMVQLQKKLLSDIGCSGSAEQLMDGEQAMRRIGDTLGTKKVLIVLDDVDKKEQIKKLIGGYSLYSGSRIIITTRNRIVLNVKGFKGVIQQYEMLKMEDGLALQLFCQHAFGREFPSDCYHGLSRKIVSSMGGLPLAIEVIGSLLNGKNEAFWKETLVRLREVPEEDILETLRISYDNLDKYQQQIFLDIACFLFNENKTDAIYMWADCQFYPIRGIKVLTDRCLIKILDNDKIWMHDHLIDLGRCIVRQESPFNPGERSRLWITKEALEIIRTKKRKDKVQALKIFTSGDSIEIIDEEFERLENLRFLELNWGTYAGDFSRCHSNLRWFSWHSPRGFRADNMYLDRLVVCKLDAIDFKDDSKAWDLIKRARNLKVLSVTRCFGITTVPDFSKCSRLERLTLADCFSLERIESFIGDLGSLIELKIEECRGLTYLPEEVGALVKLKCLSLRGCSELRELPCSLGNLTSLIELDLSKTGIAKLPNSMKGLFKLESFLLTDKTMKEFPKFVGKVRSLRVLGLPQNGSYSPENHVWELPSGISMLKILEELDLSGHDEMTGETLVGIGDLSSFRTLNLNGTQISQIPRNIDMLHYLQTLNLRNCHESGGLSECPTRTINMHHEHASSPPESASLSRLDLKTVVQLSSTLLRLDLPCSSFRWAESLPFGLTLGNLTTLEFYYVEVEDIPLDRLPGLESLTVDGCKLLQRLTISSENLRQARVSSCPDLGYISFSFSEKLESFFIFGCGSLRTINRLDCVKNLEKLEIQQCNELTDVWGLEHLKSLKSLEVTKCPSLTRLIDASCTNIPDDCFVKVQGCGHFFKDSTLSDPPGMPLWRYVQEILLDTSNFESKSDTDGAELDSSGSDEVSDYASVGESATAGTSSIDDFQLEPDNTKCFEATGNRRQIRDEGIGRYDSIDGGRTASMENRNKEKDEIGELAKPISVVGWSCQIWRGVEHYERSCKVTKEVEDQRDFSSTQGGKDATAWRTSNYKGMVKAVLKVDLHDRKDKTKALKIISAFAGVDSIEVNMKDQKLTVIGAFDPVELMAKLGKTFSTDIISVGLAKVAQEEDDNKRDDEVKMKVSINKSNKGMKDGAEPDISGSDEVSDYAPVGESLTDGTSSIDDFQLEPDNTKCFEAMGNRRQVRDEGIGHYDNIDEGETVSMENRKEEEDGIGEPANPSDVVGSSCQTCRGVEHSETSCKITTEVEDQRDFSSTEGGEKATTYWTSTKSSNGGQIIVLKVNWFSEKSRKKAITIVSEDEDIQSIDVDVENKQLTIKGDVDPLLLVEKLKKQFKEVAIVYMERDASRALPQERNPPNYNPHPVYPHYSYPPNSSYAGKLSPSRALEALPQDGGGLA